MQLPMTATAFNQKNAQEILKKESKFITNLLNLLPVPVSALQTEEDDVLLESENSEINKFPQQAHIVKKSRAKSLVELQSRLKAITSRKKLTYKEKLLKKTLKTKIKRKGKQDQRNAALKQDRLKEVSEEIKDENNVEHKTLDNGEDNNTNKMVFSKFDFTGLGKKKFRKEKFDPQKKLEDLRNQKQEIEKLRKQGEVEKAALISDKMAWKNALAKAEGQKVKDDEMLLTKSIKKREQQKKHSKRKWEARQDNVEKMKDERQKKRQENIDKRKKTKKVNKLKKAAKKGKIIPGF